MSRSSKVISMGNLWRNAGLPQCPDDPDMFEHTVGDRPGGGRLCLMAGMMSEKRFLADVSFRHGDVDNVRVYCKSFPLHGASSNRLRELVEAGRHLVDYHDMVYDKLRRRLDQDYPELSGLVLRHDNDFNRHDNMIMWDDYEHRLPTRHFIKRRYLERLWLFEPGKETRLRVGLAPGGDVDDPRMVPCLIQAHTQDMDPGWVVEVYRTIKLFGRMRTL